jgi:hypothetical protein
MGRFAFSKKEYTDNIICDDLFKKFLNEFPEYKSYSLKQLKDIWTQITDAYVEHAYQNPLGVKLGAFLGDVKVQYMCYDFKAHDYGTSNKEGIDINYINLSTRGKVAKVKWERRNVVKKNKSLQFYGFKADSRIAKKAKQKILESPDSVRVARNTLGGYSIWRQLKYKRNAK